MRTVEGRLNISGVVRLERLQRLQSHSQLCARDMNRRAIREANLDGRVDVQRNFNRSRLL
jgi:hypothetical protein